MNNDEIRTRIRNFRDKLTAYSKLIKSRTNDETMKNELIEEWASLENIFEKLEIPLRVTVSNNSVHVFNAALSPEPIFQWKTIEHAVHAATLAVGKTNGEFYLTDHDKEEFVNSNRLTELSAIVNPKFDLKKLIQYCKELNSAYMNKNYLTVPMLVRAIIDHTPPIFGFKNFSEVTNSYPGTKSFKETITHLDISCRKIADSYLHTQIRSREILPNKTQINFSTDLDVLLSEVIRIAN